MQTIDTGTELLIPMHFIKATCATCGGETRHEAGVGEADTDNDRIMPVVTVTCKTCQTVSLSLQSLPVVRQKQSFADTNFDALLPMAYLEMFNLAMLAVTPAAGMRHRKAIVFATMRYINDLNDEKRDRLLVQAWDVIGEQNRIRKGQKGTAEFDRRGRMGMKISPTAVAELNLFKANLGNPEYPTSDILRIICATLYRNLCATASTSHTTNLLTALRMAILAVDC